MTPPTEQFIETMGRHFEEEGAPRIAGRLFGALMMSDGPVSLDELADQLRVSKGSVSTNARLLDQLGLVARVTRPGDRRDYYQVTEDVPVRMIERHLAGLRRVIGHLHASETCLRACPSDVARGRLARLVDAHEQAADVLAAALDDLRGRRSAGATASRVAAPLASAAVATVEAGAAH